MRARALLLCILLSPCPAVAVETADEDPGSRKIALLVGISRYAPSGGWADLHTEADLERMRAALEAQGFPPDDIHTLHDKDADRKGIEAAFRKHLIGGAAPGAVVVFHYSGHGQRITDDDHDELDGYDEALVPFDAPRRLVDGYDGGKHLRDDDLHDWLRELRRKVGPSGDVVVSLDSCFSGAATRGLPARGAPEPLGPPQARREGSPGVDRAGGFVDAAGAPFIFFSAARHDELAFETRDEQGRPIGSLSFALSTALGNADADTTYRDLHDEVKRIMAGHVRNRPQLEGQANRRILGGRAVSQKPYYEILTYDAASNTAQVKGGALAGLLEGSRVVVHPARTRDPGNATPLATGEVRKSRTLTSEVVLAGAAGAAGIETGWLFVTAPAFGEVRIRAMIGAGEWRAALVEDLGTATWIERVDDREASDVVIEETGRGVEVVETVDETPLLAPLASAGEDLVSRVRRALEDFARNRWLRRLDATSRDIRVTLELRPCRLVTIDEASVGRVSSCAGALARTTEGGELDLRIGDHFELTLVNDGRRDAYVVVLDLMPDGRIDMLYPGREEMGEDNKLPRGKSFKIPGTFVVGEPLGNEMLKLIASRTPIDLRPILSDAPSAIAARGEGGLTSTLASGSVSTDSIPFTVSAAEEP